MGAGSAKLQNDVRYSEINDGGFLFLRQFIIHPARGQFQPSSYIPTASRTGLLLQSSARK